MLTHALLESNKTNKIKLNYINAAGREIFSAAANWQDKDAHDT